MINLLFITGKFDYNTDDLIIKFYGSHMHKIIFCREEIIFQL
jgi:hypothetical protein